MWWRRCALLLALDVGVVLGASHAHAADAPAPTADTRREAARKFAEGTRAFDTGDFTRAGQAYEEAYRLAPHEDPLWNAARAWHRAGELAHAANLYARYLREAPPGAPDRASATSALGLLTTKLARIEVHIEPGVDDARIDGLPIEATTIFVVPGTHVVRGHAAIGADVESRQTIDAGAVVSVWLAPPGSPPHEAPAAAPPPSPPPVAPHGRSGWSPVVVAVEGGLTLLVTGITVWSGLDTLSTLDEFDAAPTQIRLRDGRQKQTRTNVLIGASVGLAVVTAATALLFVDWGRGRTMRVGLGPTSAAASGTF